MTRIRSLEAVPRPYGHINGDDLDVDIDVRITTHPKLRADVIRLLKDLKEDNLDTISLDKEYHVYKITGYGDVFDVWILNDKHEPEQFGAWIFEDIR